MSKIQQEFPFTQIPDWIITHPKITHAQFRVYAAICHHSNKQRTAFPGMRRIAKDAHCSKATAEKAIPALEAIGALIVTRDPTTRRTNFYFLPMTPKGVPVSGTPVPTSDTPAVPVSGTELQHPITRTTEQQVSRTPQWQTLVELFGNPTPQLDFIHKRFSGMLERKGHTPDEIRLRAERLAASWGPEKLTLPSLEKHWERWGVPLAGVTKQQMADHQRQRELADALRSLE